MISKLWFSFIEGLKGFKRARLASGITIGSITLALMLAGLFLSFSINVNRWLGEKKAKIELEVYFDADIDDKEGKQLSKKIDQLKGILQTEFITKDAAAKRFRDGFGQDIYEVLENNPLPVSCTVKLKDGYRTGQALNGVIQSISKIDGVNDIVYEREVIALIDHYIKIIYIIIGSIGAVLIIVSSVLLFNTIRLTVLARKDIIEIMKLIGATRAFIRRPFLIEGLLQGIIGAALSSGIIYLILSGIKKFIYQKITLINELYIFIFVMGALIGFISSKASLNKYLKKI
jgi:cell division transport system permease protein